MGRGWDGMGGCTWCHFVGAAMEYGLWDRGAYEGGGSLSEQKHVEGGELGRIRILQNLVCKDAV